MNIISWNLHKISSSQQRDYTAIVREFVELRADPFVFFVLESTGNLHNARQVGDDLADAMGVGQTRPDVQVVHVGGSPSRAENVIALSRGVRNPHLAVQQDWAAEWDRRAASHQADRVAREQVRSASTGYGLRRNVAPTAHGTVYDAAHRMGQIQGDPVPAGDQLRSPALFTCSEGSVAWSIMAVHSPGPRDGQHRDMTNADVFFDSVVATLPGTVDVVIGDFNQYGRTQPGDGLRECPGLGNTTHGTTRVSRLDRIYVRRGIFGVARKFNEINNQLSDHMGIALVGAGKHPPDTTTVRQVAQAPIYGAGCSSCRTAHGGMRGIFRRWHICGSCNGVYCPGCGYQLPCVQGRTRGCPCGGQTTLVS